MRNVSIGIKAIVKAAELYMMPNTTWNRVAEQLHEDYQYPKWCPSTISKKVRSAGLLPEFYCPVCKEERPEAKQIVICDTCIKGGNRYQVATKQTIKAETKKVNRWIHRKLV